MIVKLGIKPEWCSKAFMFSIHDGLIRLSLPVTLSSKYLLMCIECSESQVAIYGSRDLGNVLKDFMSTSSKLGGSTIDYLRLLFTTLITYYHRELASIDSSVESLIDEIMTGRESLTKLYRLYNRAVKLHRGVHGLIYGLHKLSSVYEGLNPLITDVTTLEGMYSTTIDRVTSAFNLHYTVISERTNSLITKLTIISAIFLPLTLIAGIYGMNFKYMPELSQPLAYPVVLSVMALIAIGELIYFRRKGWI